MLYVLCYPRLEPSAAATIEAFRRRHEPERARMVRAHITLMFGLSISSDDDLASHVSEIAKSHAAFDLTLDRAEAHPGLGLGERHLFLMVGNAADRVRTLYTALYAGPFAAQRCEDLGFVPHMTIATATSDTAIAHAARDVPRLGLPLQGRVETLHIVRRTAEGLDEMISAPLQP